MNSTLKLLALLAAFFAARVLSAFCFNGFASWISSVLTSLLYVAIFLVFREKSEKNESIPNVKKGALMLLFFLVSMLALSCLTSIIFKPVPRKVDIMTALAAILAVPLGEEVFFRASLFKALEKALNFPIALIFSSLFFALSHTGAASIITAFFAGVILCVIFRATDSLPLIVSCHALNNLMASTLVIPQKIMPAVMLLSFVILLILLLYIRKVFLKNE